MSRLFCIALLCCGLAGFIASSRAEDKAPAAPSAQQMEMMKVMMAHAEVGPKHKELAKSAGTWDAEVESYYEGQVDKSKGTVKRSMILGGRFLQEEFKGSMMGQPFEGLMLLGYDNTLKKSTGIWIDSMSTSVAALKETEASGKLSKMTGTMTCPIEKKEITFRTVTKEIDDDHQVFEMYMTPPGKSKEELGMKITYTRAK